MKKITFLVALALAFPAAAQSPAPEKKESAKPAADVAEAPKASAVSKPAKAAKAAKKSKRQEDARHCLQQGDNNAIIRCAEEYL